MLRNLFLLIFTLLLSHCNNALSIQFEEIHPPISLQILKLDSLMYELNFFSDNRETGFTGYRIYTGATRTEAAQVQVRQFENNRSFVKEPGWCSISVTLDFSKRVRIQVGGSNIQSEFQCLVNNIKPSPEQFIAVRAGVERDCTNINTDNCFPWSEAAVVKVPL